jgi:hypothetical protein
MFLRTFKHVSSAHITVLWTIKVMATFGLQALFTYYYTDRATADIYRFFDDGILLHQIAFEQPKAFIQILFGWQHEHPTFHQLYYEAMNTWIKPHDAGIYNDNHFMIRLNAVIAFFSFGYYEVHGIIFSGLAFLGMWWSMQAFHFTSKEGAWAFALAVLFPSSLIWCSGGLKETVLLFGIGSLLKGALSNIRLVSRMAYCLLGVFVLIQVKPYFLGAFVPAYLAWRLYKNQAFAQLITWTVITLAAFTILEWSGFSLIEAVVHKQNDFIHHTQEINPGSAFDMELLQPKILDVFLHLPDAFANAVLRPFPLELTGGPSILMLLENVLFWSLMLLSMKGRISSTTTHWMLILLMMLPVLLLTGLVTPVFGAIMRYRAPALLLCLMISAPHWLRVLHKPSSSPS